MSGELTTQKSLLPTQETAALIYRQIARIMADVDPIAKGRRNTQQGYSFRGIDDVYQALQAILAKHGVFTVPTVLEEHTEDRTTKGGNALIYRVLKIRYTFYAEDGSNFDAVVIGEGMDSGDKATNKAMSVAHKYALLQVFAIPTDDPKDPENDSPEPAPHAAAKRPMPPKSAPSKPLPEKKPPAKENPETKSSAIYEGTSEQQRGVENLLRQWRVPERLWERVHSDLLNLPGDQLKGVVSKIMAAEPR